MEKKFRDVRWYLCPEHRWSEAHKRASASPSFGAEEVKERATDLLEVRHVPESIQLHGWLVLPQLTAPCLVQLPQVHLQAGTAVVRCSPCYLRL